MVLKSRRHGYGKYYVDDIGITNKEWLLSFEKLNGGIVYVENDVTCKVTSICSIYLKNRSGTPYFDTCLMYSKFEKEKKIISLTQNINASIQSHG